MNSEIKGWVYIITNKAMPGIIKIGYSTKDPKLRAMELAGTGAPHPYEVKFEVLVYNPSEVERRAHRILKSFREGKEWYRCSLDQAIIAIQKAAGNKVIKEFLYTKTLAENIIAKNENPIEEIFRIIFYIIGALGFLYFAFVVWPRYK
jgi:hypothetical protein